MLNFISKGAHANITCLYTHFIPFAILSSCLLSSAGSCICTDQWRTSNKEDRTVYSSSSPSVTVNYSRQDDWVTYVVALAQKQLTTSRKTLT